MLDFLPFVDNVPPRGAAWWWHQRPICSASQQGYQISWSWEQGLAWYSQCSRTIRQENGSTSYFKPTDKTKSLSSNSTKPKRHWQSQDIRKIRGDLGLSSRRTAWFSQPIWKLMEEYLVLQWQLKAFPVLSTQRLYFPAQICLLCWPITSILYVILISKRSEASGIDGFKYVFLG